MLKRKGEALYTGISWLSKIEGALSPNELKGRLMNAADTSFRGAFVAYAEDIIESEIPPIPVESVDVAYEGLIP